MVIGYFVVIEWTLYFLDPESYITYDELVKEKEEKKKIIILQLEQEKEAKEGERVLEKQQEKTNNDR